LLTVCNNHLKRRLSLDLIDHLFAGGGAFPFTIGRIDHGHECRPDLCAHNNPRRPSSYIGRFYVDSLVHDSRALKFLVEVIGEDCISLGSDYPFPLGEERPGELILQTYSDDHEKCDKLLNKNARRFFKLL
jgi:aminocarboxymuconate-semialdehyde decarboxylase